MCAALTPVSLEQKFEALAGTLNYFKEFPELLELKPTIMRSPYLVDLLRGAPSPGTPEYQRYLDHQMDPALFLLSKARAELEKTQQQERERERLLQQQERERLQQQQERERLLQQARQHARAVLARTKSVPAAVHAGVDVKLVEDTWDPVKVAGVETLHGLLAALGLNPPVDDRESLVSRIEELSSSADRTFVGSSILAEEPRPSAEGPRVSLSPQVERVRQRCQTAFRCCSLLTVGQAAEYALRILKSSPAALRMEVLFFVTDLHHIQLFSVSCRLTSQVFHTILNGKDVVVKLPRRNPGFEVDPAGLVRNEVAILGDLNGIRGVPHVLNVFENNVGFIMEPYARQKLPQGASVQILRDVFTGLVDVLAAVHAKGIVHRDIRPPNILIHGDQPLLIDWGFAVRASEPHSYCGTLCTASDRVLELICSNHAHFEVTPSDDLVSLISCSCSAVAF
eukprot:m51a1_g11396 putative protein kinase (454) ;mRNA; f:4305-9567